MNIQKSDGENKVKILHITTIPGSLSVLMKDQLLAFIDHGYEVLTAAGPGDIVPELINAGVKHFEIKSSTREMSIVSDVKALFQTIKLLREQKPDIVHTHTPKPGLWGRLAAGICRTPIVVNTIHGLYVLPSDRLLKRTIFYSAERIAAMFSDAELSQSIEDIPVLKSIGIPEEKLILLGNGVDLSKNLPSTESDAARSRIRQELKVADDEILIGSVGRLVAEKGFIELFDAIEMVKESCPKARFVVVGRNDPSKPDALDEAEVVRAREMGVLFIGYRKDVADILKAMDIFVLASRREGFPRAAMEASATGLPVIATNIRGCRQVVDHDESGYLYEVGDTRQLANHLVHLADNPPIRQEMGVKAIAKAKKDFDVNTVIGITLTHYQRLLDEWKNR